MNIRVYLVLLLACLPGAAAWADGPHIAFHGTEGAYTVTLFSAPDPLVAGPVNLTLMVQNAGTGQLAVPSKAEGQLRLAGQVPVRFLFSSGSADADRLPAATAPLLKAGTYTLELNVSVEGDAPARFTGVLPVAENHGQRNTVLWAVFLPLAAVALFLLNQYGKAQMHRGRH